LDTGYDPEAAFFRTPDRKRRIQGWKDMVVDNSTVRRDEDGHGTYVLSLLMKVAPAADFYVVRVARNTNGLANSTENIAKVCPPPPAPSLCTATNPSLPQAITWAATTRHADIISMSFGFSHEIHVNGTPLISNAISNALHARNQRILFFAAAANQGGNQPEMFPANHAQVISVRGCDDKGWLAPFNPPRGSTGIDGVMTLGQDVPGAALSQDAARGQGEVCRSGTSVSTPIAAGIAALLLGYARLYEGELMEGYYRDADTARARVADLWTVAGMRRLLRKPELATEMPGRWHYLSVDGFLGLEHKVRLALLAS
jgi:subtilisin family serine protease